MIDRWMGTGGSCPTFGAGTRLDDHLSDGVQRALGRPPRDFARFVKDAAAAGAWLDR
ncbi:hypothetical protein [Nonomuraea insulae]|uniref:Uncharacterized protein n=1 Tax=Nonomuraea insulae TaxID=1616787 RepID=A0ABW1CVV4_9ACTN